MKKNFIPLSGLILLILAGCTKRPYERFKKQRTIVHSKETSAVIKTLKKKNLTKRVKEMSATEALEAKAYYESIGRTDMVLVLMPHIIAVSQEIDQIATTMLEYADLQLSLGNLEEAEKLYSKFIALYPGHEQIKTARYRRMLSAFWDLPSVDCDQSKTKTIVEYGTNYLRDFPDDPEYRNDVHAILMKCYENLLANELHALRFYLNKFYYQNTAPTLQAAFGRMKFIQSNMLFALERYDSNLKELSETLKQELSEHEAQQDEDLQVRAAFLEAWYNKLLPYTDDQHFIEHGNKSHARDIF